MKINYAIADLHKIIRCIYKISGCAISIWDTELKQIAYEPSHHSRFCTLIKTKKEGYGRCLGSDIAILSEAREKRALCVHRCHAGLIDAAMPVLRDGNILGYIMFGQLQEPTEDKPSFDMVWEHMKDLGFDRDEMEEAFGRIRYIDREGVDAIGEILNFCISYIVSQNLMAVENNVLADYITSYVEENLKGDLSVNALCRRFGISKNTLYRVSHDHFGTTILDYITKKRIDTACRLLRDGSLSLTEVCDRVGMTDYNYFFKVFKKRTGVSPRRYRKGV